MSFSKKASSSPRQPHRATGDAYLDALRRFSFFGQLDTKIARARAHDRPVLYAQILPGLDVLLCTVRGAAPPYPSISALRRCCMEYIAHALEQPLDGLSNGGYWYEAHGLGFLIFASDARSRVLPEFGAEAIRDLPRPDR